MSRTRDGNKAAGSGPAARAARTALAVAVLALLPLLWLRVDAAPAGGGRTIALSFDDGPFAPFTGSILSVLEQEGVRATFFFIGRNAENDPALARAVAAGGHEIGSHTYSHPWLKHLSRDAVEREVEEGRRAVEAAAGVRTSLFRCPYGERSPFLEQVCRDLGLTLIPFGVSGKDWEAGSSREIADAIVGAAHPGAIILLHDGSTDPGADRTLTVEATRLVIRELKGRGYRFVTVSEVLPSRTGVGFAMRRILGQARSRFL